jgi:hypothetical protein
MMIKQLLTKKLRGRETRPYDTKEELHFFATRSNSQQSIVSATMPDFDEDRHRREETDRREKRKVCHVIYFLGFWAQLKIMKSSWISFNKSLSYALPVSFIKKQLCCRHPRHKSPMDNEKRNGNEESTPKKSWENTVARIPRGKKRKLHHSLKRNRNFKISLRREHKDFKLTLDFAMPHPGLL